MYIKKAVNIVDRNLLFIDNLMELTGFERIKKQIDYANRRAIKYKEELIDPVKEFIEENNMTGEDMIKINNY